MQSAGSLGGISLSDPHELAFQLGLELMAVLLVLLVEEDNLLVGFDHSHPRATCCTNGEAGSGLRLKLLELFRASCGVLDPLEDPGVVVERTVELDLDRVHGLVEARLAGELAVVDAKAKAGGESGGLLEEDVLVAFATEVVEAEQSLLAVREFGRGLVRLHLA